MATSASEDFGVALAGLVQIVFSPLFPLMLMTLCALSFVLALPFHLMQFVLFAGLAWAFFNYATQHLWAMLAFGVFVVAAFPLTWIGFREHVTQTSRVIGYWIAAALYGAGMLWLASVWPYSGGVFQQLVFGLLIFCWWAHVCETLMGTFKIIALSRPQPGPEVVQRQKVHGDARLASEAEALSFLNSKK